MFGVGEHRKDQIARGVDLARYQDFTSGSIGDVHGFVLSGDCRQKCRQAVEILFVRVSDEALQRRIAGVRLKQDAPGQRGFPGKRLECHRHRKTVHRAEMQKNDAFRRRDFGQLRLVVVLGAVRPMHREPPGPAGMEIKLVERIGEAVWSPPEFQMIRIGEGVKQHLPGRVENALADDFHFTLGNHFTLHRHFSSPQQLRLRCDPNHAAETGQRSRQEPAPRQ